MKLLTAGAANRTVIGGNRPEHQTHPLKNAGVGVKHQLIRLLQASSIAIKGVGVLHAELTSAHDAKTRAALIAKLGLNLIEVHWQLLITADFIAGQIGHYLFGGGLN